ncbi:MAG: bifunctional 5,10-methylenetetrahydrofolate dehydrogenase/5,10-methenyltetrahydrofolate cyclohydrolase [Lachnospiraceae bacterium]|nr:bifunctional 5,10-methylenetetrahydrofolate dehydrogenase/5,10-methenyltetrahydrofolate cyclohydrolase [Lachnospiraceae bacterium]
MAQLLKGAPAAAALTEELAGRCGALKEKNIRPTLALLRVGENESDLAYERGILKRCDAVGIEVRKVLLPADTDQGTVLAEIAKINSDNEIHGCLMFRPLPKHLNEAEICEALDARKDADCMTERSLTHVFTGRGEGFAPCTAESCIEILKYYGYNLSGKNVAVIGRSLVIGKPVSMLLQKENATVTMCHTKTADLPSVCRDKDILVVAAGRARIVDASYTNASQAVIDVGINVDADGNMCGDVDFASVEPVCGAITPVPGGVGSVTTAILCRHVIEAAERL